MHSNISWLKRYQSVLFYSLAFGISWGSLALAIGPRGIPGTPAEFEAALPIVLLGFEGGPAIAAILSTFLVQGGPGLRELWMRLCKWRVGARWYAAALIPAPLLMLGIPLILAAFWPQFLPRIFMSADRAGLIAMGIAAGLLGGFLEELGWTGFALPALRQRYSLLTTGLIMGLLWGLWHVPMNVWSSGDASGALVPALFLHSFIFSIGILTAYRILMVWVYEHTGSLLAAMLMHFSLIFSNVYFVPKEIEKAPGPIWSLVIAAALWLIVIVVQRAGQFSLSERSGAPAS